jgi:hypothetical protein
MNCDLCLEEIEDRDFYVLHKYNSDKEEVYTMLYIHTNCHHISMNILREVWSNIISAKQWIPQS